LATALYSVELIGALVLLIQGLLIVSTIEYFESYKFSRLVHIYSKVAICVYVVAFIVRVGIYIKLSGQVAKVDPDYEGGFAAFLGNSVNDKEGSIVMTAVLICVFMICMAQQLYYLCCISKHMVKRNSYKNAQTDLEREAIQGINGSIYESSDGE